MQELPTGPILPNIPREHISRELIDPILYGPILLKVHVYLDLLKEFRIIALNTIYKNA